jgi:MscS family membrane protein
MLVSTRFTRCVLAVALVVTLQPVSVAQGQATPATTEEKNTLPNDTRLKNELSSPRRTMQTFLLAVKENRWNDASDCLDFSGMALTEDARSRGGSELAFKLKHTIDRMMMVDLQKIPDQVDAPQPYRLADQADAMNEADAVDAGLISIARSSDGLWRFSSETINEIEILFTRWKSRDKIVGLKLNANSQMPFSMWLEQRYPESRRQTHFLFPDYQWINILIVIFVGFVADLLTRGLLRRLTAAWFKFRRGEEPPEQKRLWRPVGLFVQAVVWYSGTMLIGLPHWAQIFLLAVLKAFAVLAAVWTAFHFIELLTKIMKRKAESTETKFDDLLVPLVAKTLKIFAVCIGVMVCAEAFHWRITGLLAGVGIGGMALALASQDAVSNIFGSVTVLLDRPFEVGDWIVTGDIEGTVETVGFRSTRVRTFYNSLVTVPNSQLTTAVVDNLGKRRYRRIKTMIGLQYDTTPEQIDTFCEGVRELLRRHPYTRKDYYHVYLNQFSGSSLDILLYCFLECPDWSVELRERHRLFVDILKLADQLGVSFAFPTRTLHMFQEDASPQFDMSSLGPPHQAGQHTAAQIAGPLLDSNDRPGGVEFCGPSPTDNADT